MSCQATRKKPHTLIFLHCGNVKYLCLVLKELESQQHFVHSNRTDTEEKGKNFRDVMGNKAAWPLEFEILV